MVVDQEPYLIDIFCAWLARRKAAKRKTTRRKAPAPKRKKAAALRVINGGKA